MYVLDLGHIEKNIAQQAVRAGEPIPDRIANAPELEKGLNLYLQAFFDLDGERSHAFSPTPIPWSSIKQYCEYYEFDNEQSEDLFFHIRRMDNAHLKRLNAKNNKGK